ncbi:MAG: hypothetical protein H6590_09005 [Flavobacteriales bacterium]|nr:hypothetical protein [Flavobacteriales bacterium]
MGYFRSASAIAILALLSTSCKKVECMQCIVEDNAGMIIENRVYCESYDAARQAFVRGLRDRYAEQPDTVNIQCTDFDN